MSSEWNWDPHAEAIISGFSAAYGSLTIPSETIDQNFGIEIGKLRKRAGIQSVSHAAPDESELSLGTAAALAAIDAAGMNAGSLDWILAVSETHRSVPSLAAGLHSGLKLRDSCGALDVGGACLGLLHSLATAQAFQKSGQAKNILIVTADLHSRTLIPGRVRGEFGGLFGDGASAFIVQSSPQRAAGNFYRLGEFFFGCASQYARAIQLQDRAHGELDVVFDGDALSRAAITKMTQIFDEVESKSGFSRRDTFGFATHQPNPRLVSLLAKQAGVAGDRFPRIAEFHGNLGSSTCGAALHELLNALLPGDPHCRKPIFLASLGPGLLFGGGWLSQ